MSNFNSLCVGENIFFKIKRMKIWFKKKEKTLGENNSFDLLKIKEKMSCVARRVNKEIVIKIN